MTRTGVFSRAAVAAAEPVASGVGADILRRGGNAVDAAVAVGFALAVTFPEAGNLGGGGFLLFRRADGFARAIDYRESGPKLARADIYVKDGRVIEGNGGPNVGWRASGTPGTVAGLADALKLWGSGKFSFAELIEPARALAANGFVISADLANSTKASAALLDSDPESKRLYRKGGAGLVSGEKLVLPELAATLSRLQKRGAREFYDGETARAIDSAMRKNDGLVRLSDLRDYHVRQRAPLVGAYRGQQIITMPPPSSGGAVLLQMLGMLERFDLARLGSENPVRWHLLVEAMRRAFADRAVHFGDPDFVRVPIENLTAPDYIRRQSESIDTRRATPSASVRAGVFPGFEPDSTTHFSIADSAGNAVSNTYTLNGGYGSGVTIPEIGVLMNNEMDDFAAQPGVANRYGLIQGRKNAVGPGRRPLSSMTPTFVVSPDSGLRLVIGSPGGPTIINTVLQTILNVVDHKMPIDAAIGAPRIHHQWLPDEIAFERAMPTELRTELSRMGHVFAARPRALGDAQGIERTSEGWRAASDPRGAGTPAGL